MTRGRECKVLGAHIKHSVSEYDYANGIAQINNMVGW